MVIPECGLHPGQLASACPECIRKGQSAEALKRAHEQAERTYAEDQRDRAQGDAQ